MPLQYSILKLFMNVKQVLTWSYSQDDIDDDDIDDDDIDDNDIGDNGIDDDGFDDEDDIDDEDDGLHVDGKMDNTTTSWLTLLFRQLR